MNQPFLSIITVCYNAADLLRGTMDSVVNQSDKDFEYIVVDGASKDETLNIIEEYSEHISKWITEPDRGIYDAMNKGLALARGRYVWFLNAGDHAFDEDVIRRLKVKANSDTDVLYGEVMIVDDERNHLGTRSEITVHTLPENLKKADMHRGMIVCHQGFIASRKLAPNFIMDNLSADIDWVIKILDKAKAVLRVDGIIASYLAGGTSKKRWYRSLRDRYSILADHFGVFNAWVNHVIIVPRAIMHKFKRSGKTHY